MEVKSRFERNLENFVEGSLNAAKYVSKDEPCIAACVFYVMIASFAFPLPAIAHKKETFLANQAILAREPEKQGQT